MDVQRGQAGLTATTNFEQNYALFIGINFSVKTAEDIYSEKVVAIVF